MSNVHYLPLPPAVRAVESVSPVRAQAEALMRTLVKDTRNARIELSLIADLLDPMIARMEADNAGR